MSTPDQSPPSPPPAYSVGSEPTRDAAQGLPLCAEVAAWLGAWVGEHSGTDLKDERGALRLYCDCGAYLGISYGPTQSPVDAAEREATAYFEHQAADLLAWLTKAAETPTHCSHCQGCPPPHHGWCGDRYPHGEHPLPDGRPCCGSTL